MYKEGHDLGHSIRSEECRCNVGKGHDDDRVEHEQLPDALVLQIKDLYQQQNDEYRYVSLDDVGNDC